MFLLEHIHLNVQSIAKTEHFLKAAVPELNKRGAGDVQGFGPWAHYGSDDCYIALTEAGNSRRIPELRHIGLVVDDIELAIKRLAEAGYEPADTSALDSHPFRRRVYYVDGNQVDWELVEYLSEDPQQRNDYSH